MHLLMKWNTSRWCPKKETTYEIMKPEMVGVTEKLVLGKHSGRHAFVDRLKGLGYSLMPEEIEKSLKDLKLWQIRKRKC